MPETDSSPRHGSHGGELASRFGIRAALAGVALALVAVPFALLWLLVEEQWRPLLNVDEGSRDALHRLALDHDRFVSVLRAVSFAGSSPVYTVVFAVEMGWLLRRGLRNLALFVVVTIVGSALLNALVKQAVDRSRPVLPDPLVHLTSKSFPSGHAQAAIVAYGVLLLLFLPALRGRWRHLAVAIAVLMVAAIGFSRVGLGAHYVSDVLAGYVLGAAWLAATTAAFSAWRREQGRPGVDPTRGLEPEHAEVLDPRNPGPPEASSSG